jgi:Protein of unknown function (DUF2442)
MAAELTQQEIDYQIDAAIARSAEDLSEPKANEVTYDKQSRRIIIHFNNDCTFECPIYLLQGVCDLEDDAVAKVKLTPAGWGVTWLDADIDFGVNELVRGIFGTKSWMKKIAARNGRSKSEQKLDASEISGAKRSRLKTAISGAKKGRSKKVS